MTGAVGRLMISGPLVGEHRSGPGVHLLQLVRALLSRRPELAVVTRHCTLREPHANRESAARIGPRVRAVTTPVPATLLRALQAGVRLPTERMLAGRFDVYHQLHTDADPAVPGHRLVVTMHDTVALDWPDEEGHMYRHAGRLLHRAAAVVTVSEASKSAICDAFTLDPGRVHVVPNGVDHARFRPRDGAAPPGDRYVLYAGGHTPRKNVPRIIESFAAVRAQRPDQRLALVLAGPVIAAEPQLRAAAPRNLPPDALRFVGHVTDEEMPKLYSDAAALLYPSLAEGFGLPIVEAMACGIPVVTSDRGAMREVAGDAATLVDPEDADSIAAGLAHVLSGSAGETDRRRALGLRRAAAFSWPAAAEKLLAIYDRLATP